MDEKRVVVKKGGGFGSMFSGFILGSLIGATVALLAAPQSGEETRAMIRDRASDMRDQAMDMADQTKNKAQQMASDIKDQASDTVQKVKNKASDAMNRGSSVVNDPNNQMGGMSA
jgi:gas vesicle protein